jgi:hypothetical protein
LLLDEAGQVAVGKAEHEELVRAGDIRDKINIADAIPDPKPPSKFV